MSADHAPSPDSPSASAAHPDIAVPHEEVDELFTGGVSQVAAAIIATLVLVGIVVLTPPDALLHDVLDLFVQDVSALFRAAVAF